MRSADTVARVGGDEFIVLLDEVARPDDAAHVARSLIEHLKEPFILSTGQKVYVGASVGISMFPDDSAFGTQLIQFADAALYQAKSAGRGTYSFYTAALTLAANVRLETEASLQRGLERNEFILHYQPLVRVSDGRSHGVEAWCDGKVRTKV